MANNKDKKESLHDRLPELFNSRNNTNWKAIVEAIGGQDDVTSDLIEQVRQQFFVKTAQRPYIDRLGANNNVNRPRFVGMDDPTFRRYIPVLAYQPKQVKLILDLLLDIFFFKDSTTTFIESTASAPFNLKDGWELEMRVDSDPDKEELIKFSAEDFTDISQATADELVSAINRQAKNFYAVKYEDSIKKRIFIRIFTRTIGSKGSIEMTGGRANFALKFSKVFNEKAGNGNNTIWQFTKIGDEVSMKYIGGNSPQIDSVQEEDIVVLDMPGNEGSYRVTSVDLGEQIIRYRNLFSTVGTQQQVQQGDVHFLNNYKAAVYKQRRRAITWEIQSGEILVELPTSPPVVKRNRKGAAHLNGEEATMTQYISDSSIELDDAADWPDTGFILIEPEQQIKSRHLTSLEDIVADYNFKGRLIGRETMHRYTGKVGNVLTGITPALPPVSEVLSVNIVSAVRTNDIMTVTTDAPHKLTKGMHAAVQGMTPTIGMSEYSPNGSWEITEIVSPTKFKVKAVGDDGQSTGGVVRAERIGLSPEGSKVLLHTAVLQPDKHGPYMWDTNAAFVLSSLTTNLTASIKAGDTARGIEVNPNDILNEQGYLVFDFGTENQEGPIRYFFKPNSNTIAIDPSHVFQKNHDAGSSVTMIRRRGAHILSGAGSEFPAYVTDTSAARKVLFDLMQQVKSVGIFINFLVRFPEQLYATLDVYESGTDPDDNWKSS